MFFLSSNPKFNISVDPEKKSGKKWIATQDYDCYEAPGQINLKEGEELEELIPDTKGWTRVKNKKGEEGLVRTTFLGIV